MSGLLDKKVFGQTHLDCSGQSPNCHQCQVVPQGSILALFNTFTNSIDKGIKCILGKFAGSTKLSDVVENPKGWNAI